MPLAWKNGTIDGGVVRAGERGGRLVHKRELLARVRNNPRNLRFLDLLRLVEAAGFEFKRQVGSHRQYWHSTAHEALNLQPDTNGKAKVSQVREYPIVVFWSDEDEAFIADVPDVRHCSAHGETPEEALREVRLALVSTLGWMQEEGIPLPPPTVRPTLRT